MTDGFADAARKALRAAAPESASAGGAVESVVVRVTDPAGPALVTVERTGGGVRVACSCGRRPCPHLGEALDAFSGARPGETIPQPIARMSVPPPSSPSAPESGRDAVRPSDADLATRLGTLLDALVEDGIAGGSERVDAEIEALVRSLHGTDAYGLHRSLADLRREVSTARPSPDRMLRAVEVLAATRRALDGAAKAGGAPAGRDAYALLVGRDRPLAEMEIRENVTLLEVARNSARTPFGYRREEAFLVDLATGARFGEMTPAPLSGDPVGGPDRYRGSVGPFPRLVRGDLVAIEPGPEPRRIRLLQYRVERPDAAEHFRRLRDSAAQETTALYAEWARLADAAGCPYPCLAVFAPKRVAYREGEAALLDGDDRILPLARATAPDTCAAADRFLARGRVEVVVGHLFLFRDTLALSPLSLLMDLPAGERLVRLR